MKKKPAPTREEIQKATDSYLASGGEIKHVGFEPGEYQEYMRIKNNREEVDDFLIGGV